MIDGLDVEEELTPQQARKLLSYILHHGSVAFSKHARDELAADGLSEVDARNVLTGGQIYEPGELIRESWRYRVHTAKMAAVVVFDSVTLCVVVTAWKKKGGHR